jgi:enoyl-CoA hydratase
VSGATYVRLERDGPVATLVLHNPPRNALTAGVLRDTAVALDALALDPPHALVVTGDGAAFSGGADLRELAEATPRSARALAVAGQDCLERLESAAYPVIAAINGDCLGGGLELALACHLRVVSADASLGLPEVTLGLVPALGGARRLPALVGTARATELVLTGRRIRAAEAHRLGLVNAVVPAAEVRAQATRLARRIAGKPAAAVRAALRCLRPAAPPHVELDCLEALLATDQLRQPTGPTRGPVDRREPS